MSVPAEPGPRAVRDRLAQAYRRYADALDGRGDIARALRCLQRAEYDYHQAALRAHTERTRGAELPLEQA